MKEKKRMIEIKMKRKILPILFLAISVLFLIILMHVIFGEKQIIELDKLRINGSKVIGNIIKIN
ncbi:hypothetical protein [Anaerosporobacter sp.]